MTLIQSLPLELLLSICDFLPPSGAICLALTCRSAYRALKQNQKLAFQAVAWPGVYQWDVLHIDIFHPAIDDENVARERLTVLQLLEKDLPGRYLCHYCLRLRVSSENPGLKDYCMHNDDRCARRAHGMPFPYHFTFFHVQMIMKRYRHGPSFGCPVSVLDISSSWTKVNGEYESPFRSPATFKKFDAHPLLYKGQLLLHRTYRYWWTSYSVWGQLRPFYEAPWSPIKLCDHMIAGHEGESYLNEFLTVLENLRRAMEKGNSTENCFKSPLKSCSICSTEFVATFHNHGVNGVEMVVDAWQTLGTGQSPSQPGFGSCYETACRTSYERPNYHYSVHLQAIEEPGRFKGRFADTAGISAINTVSGRQIMLTRRKAEEESRRKVKEESKRKTRAAHSR